MKPVALGFLVAIATALPATATEGQSGATPDPVLHLLTRGFTEVSSFPTKTSFTGYSLREPKSGRRIALYYDPQAKVVIYGIGFDLVANKQLGPPMEKIEQPLPSPVSATNPPDSQNKIAKAVPKMAYVQTSGAVPNGTNLYVVVEPSCGFCRTSYRDIMAKLGDVKSPLSRVNVRWVPVALAPSNFRQVAFSLDESAATPGERAGMIFGAKVPAQASAGANRLATANLAAFQTLGLEGTPTFVLVKDGATRVSVGYEGIEALQTWLK